MTYPDLALLGRAGAGKDTAAEYLVAHYGYVRLALADPLREMALAIDPIVYASAGPDVYEVDEIRLSEVVEDLGWDRAKREHPEVRRLLMEMGKALRAQDEDYLMNILRYEIDALPMDQPCVVTDVRFPNELAALRDEGSAVGIWVERDVPQLDDPTETSVGPADADYPLYNRRDLPALYTNIDTLLAGL